MGCSGSRLLHKTKVRWLVCWMACSMGPTVYVHMGLRRIGKELVCLRLLAMPLLPIYAVRT